LAAGKVALASKSQRQSLAFGLFVIGQDRCRLRHFIYAKFSTGRIWPVFVLGLRKPRASELKIFVDARLVGSYWQFFIWFWHFKRNLIFMVKPSIVHNLMEETNNIAIYSIHPFAHGGQSRKYTERTSNIGLRILAL
jgi:hypothetical protein